MGSRFPEHGSGERRTLLAAVIALVALLAATSVAVAVRFERDQVRLYTENLHAVVGVAATQLEENLREVMKFVEVLSHGETALEVEEDQLRELLAQVVESLRDHGVFMAVAERRGETVTARAGGEEPDVASLLDAVRMSCTTGPGGPCVTRVERGQGRYWFVVSGRRPIPAGDGSVLVAVALDWRRAADQITARTRLDRWSKTFVLDRDGTLLSWPADARKPGFSVLNREAGCNECHRDLESEPTVGDAAWRATTLEIQERAHVVVTAPVRVAGERMVVGMVAPRAAALERHGSTMVWGISLLAAIAITAGFTVFRLHRLGTRQVRTLQSYGEEIRRLNEQLEEKVRARTRQLVEAHTHALELQRSQAALDRLAAVGELAAAFAHEVRTPLNALSIAQQRLSRMVRRGEAVEPAQALEILETQGQAVEVINSYVENYLQFTRKARAEVSARVDACKLSELVREVFGYVELEAETAGIELRAYIEPEDLTVRLDQGKLRHVLANLVLNAVQVQPRGGEVAVSARVAGDRLLVEVADRGPGIPEEHAAEIFEPFRSFREGGTGLGLAICQRLVKEEGASLSHAPRDEGGSIFALSWPI